MRAMVGKVQIVQASMFVRKVKLMPSVAHAKTLERSPAKYPIRRVVCKSFTIPQNYLDVSHEKLFFGQLPTRVVIGLVDNRAYNGDRQRNPFNFQHFNLNEIAVYLDSQQQHAVRPVQPDYEHGLYIRAYNSMFAGTGKVCKDDGLYISREDYSAGYALYAFDLTADLGEEDHFSLVRQGSVRLSLKFRRRSPTPSPLSPTRNSRTLSRWIATGTSSSTLEYERVRDRSHPSTRVCERL